MYKYKKFCVVNNGPGQEDVPPHAVSHWTIAYSLFTSISHRISFPQLKVQGLTSCPLKIWGFVVCHVSGHKCKSCIRPSCIRPHRSSMTCECVTCVNYSCACTGQRLNQGSPFPTPVTLARLTWSFPVLRVGNWRASFFYAYMLTLAGEVSHAYPPRSVEDQICLDRKKNVGYGYL